MMAENLVFGALEDGLGSPSYTTHGLCDFG